MKILAIRGANLASLPRFDIDLMAAPLASAGLFAITGDTGAGKSTILDALCLALYGTYPRVATKLQGDKIKDPGGDEVPSDDPRNILRRGASSGFAQADFVGFDGRVYTAAWDVRRARDKADGRLQAATYRLDLKDGSAAIAAGRTAVESAVERATGFTFQQFKRTVLLAQGEFDAFLQANESDRAELLEKITGHDIYSLISRRVFEETAARNSALEARRQTLAAIAVLDEPARLALIGERADGATATAALTGQAARVGAAIGAIETAASARSKVEAALAQHRAALAASEAASPDRTLLAAIDACEPLRRLAERGHETSTALAATSRAAEAAATACQAAMLSRDRAAAEEDMAAHGAKSAADAVSAAEPAWQQAALLDERISAVRRALEPAAAEVTRRRAAAEAAGAGLETAAAELAESHSRRAALDTRLTQTAPHASLAASRDAITRAFAARADLTARRTLARVQGVQAAKEWEAAGAALAKADAARETATGKTEALARELQTARAGRAALDNAGLEGRSRALHALAAHVAQAHDLLTRTAALGASVRETDARLAATLTAVAKTAERGTALEAERDRFDRDRTALAPLAELASAQLSEAAAHLRHTLADGTPCPVCGALSHPVLGAGSAAGLLARETLVRKQALDADIARTAGALSDVASQSAKARAEALHARGVLDGLMAEQGDVADRLGTAMGVVARAAPLAGLMIALDPQRLQMSGPALAAFAAGVTQRQDEIAIKLATAAVVTKDIERIEGDLTAAGHTRDAALLALEAAREQRLAADRARTQLLAQTASLDDQLAANGAGVAVYLDLAGLTLTDADADPKGFLARLLGLGADHLATLAAHVAETDTITRLEKRAHAAEIAVTTGGEALAAAVKAFDDQTRALVPLVAARAVLIGGEAVAAHKARLTDVARTALEAFERARRSRSAAETTHASALARHQGAVTALASAHSASAAATAQLTEAAMAIDQTGEAVAAHLASPRAWTDALRHRLMLLDETQAATAATLATRQRDCEAALLAADMAPEETLAGLITERDRIGHQRDRLTARQAEIAQSIRLDDDARAKAAGHGQEIAIAEAAHAVWADVNAAIGQKDGALFRRFAQSVTLRELLALGDRKLAALNPRYGLKPGSVSYRGIEIVDRDMVEEVRSPRSLSGGERFLVSLALALALAELEGKSSFVDTLFIDEGFGSLDRETLDIAIDALERLQDDGRKVGVVTHVAAMIERIGVQVRVERQGGGRSRVRVVDGTGGTVE